MDFAFSLKQKVLIIDADVYGRIDSILYSVDGIQYRVAYWVDSIRRLEWVYPHEIKSVQQDKLIKTD